MLFATQKPVHLLKSARGGRGYLIRSELGSTTPGEDYKRMASSNSRPMPGTVLHDLKTVTVTSY